MTLRSIVVIISLASTIMLALLLPVADQTQGAPAEDVRSQYTGTYYVTQDNAVISNLDVHGNIVVEAKNVTMKNISLVSATPWHALSVKEGASGFSLEDSEIDGRGSTVNAIFGFGSFLRNDLHDVENGINVTGPSMIRDNLIHDLNRGPEAHYDGIEINGGHDITIIGNTITNDHDQTSAVMMDNYFDGLSNITIDSNRLIGGGYTIYLDGRFSGGAVNDASIRIINNQIGKGFWGKYAFYGKKPVISSNVDISAGKSLDALKGQ